MNNDLFKGKKFWEAFVNYVIDKEIALSIDIDEKNGVIPENDKENEEKYGNIVFAQLMPMIDNMNEFGLDINIIEEIILPLIDKFKIIPEFAEEIKTSINAKKKDLNNQMEKQDNIIKEENNND